MHSESKINLIQMKSNPVQRFQKCFFVLYFSSRFLKIRNLFALCLLEILSSNYVNSRIPPAVGGTAFKSYPTAQDL